MDSGRFTSSIVNSICQYSQDTTKHPRKIYLTSRCPCCIAIRYKLAVPWSWMFTSASSGMTKHLDERLLLWPAFSIEHAPPFLSIRFLRLMKVTVTLRFGIPKRCKIVFNKLSVMCRASFIWMILIRAAWLRTLWKFLFLGILRSAGVPIASLRVIWCMTLMLSGLFYLQTNSQCKSKSLV